MVENEKFIKKDIEMNVMNNVIVIDDSNYKSSRPSNVKFSTNYLPFNDQLKLMLVKNKIQYFRNKRILFFVIFAPFFFLGILQCIQDLSEYYNDSVVITEPEINNLNNSSLKCGENCTSLGIALIVIYF
jgi:hypothetical protein